MAACGGGRRSVRFWGLWEDCAVLEFSPHGSDLAVGWDLFLGVFKGFRWHCPMLSCLVWMDVCCMRKIRTPAGTLRAVRNHPQSETFPSFQLSWGSIPSFNLYWFSTLILLPTRDFLLSLGGIQPTPFWGSLLRVCGLMPSACAPLGHLSSVSYSAGKKSLTVSPIPSGSLLAH